MTLPVGVPLPGAVAETVAVKVTAWPNTEGSVAETSEVVVFAWLTTWLKAVEVLDVKLASPPYDTVIDWVATPRLEVVRLALPPLRVAVPRELEPSLKVTVPVGVPLPGAAAATVAVKVTDWPKTEGFADDVTEVVVASLVTVCGQD